MSISITTINKLNPVYNNIELEATETTATSAFTYTFQVYINSTLTYTIIQTANPELKAEINLTSLLSNHFESSIYTNSSNIFEIVSDGILDYSVTVTSKNSAGTTVDTASTGTLYCFNGIVQDFESFNINDYLMVSSVSTGNFLSKLNKRRVTENSKAYLSVINGNFGLGSNPSFTGIHITAVDKDNATRTATSSYSNATASIVSIDCSITKLNTLQAGLITSDTEYYVIKELNNKSNQSITFQIEREKKVKEVYNIHYINSLSAVDSFDFTKVKNEALNITRNVFEQQKIKKVYNTNVDQTISIYSNWINEDQSEALKDLWYSPASKLYDINNNTFRDIIINSNNVLIKNKYNSELIQYQVPFKYSANYKVQKY